MAQNSNPSTLSKHGAALLSQLSTQGKTLFSRSEARSLTSLHPRHLDNLLQHLVMQQWLLRMSKVTSNSDVATMPAEVRDGLAHQLSLPENLLMVDTMSEAAKQSGRYDYVFSPKDFIDAVEQTVSSMTVSNPTAQFDPRPRGSTPRGPGVGFDLGPMTSGSAADAAAESRAESPKKH